MTEDLEPNEQNPGEEGENSPTSQTEISADTILTGEITASSIADAPLEISELSADKILAGSIARDKLVAHEASTLSHHDADDYDDFVDINLAHFSMQFSDSEKQQAHDSSKIFKRGYRWITGTEAGGNGTLIAHLRLDAHANGYTLFMYKALWIAVRKDVIVKGSYSKEGETVVDNSKIKANVQDAGFALVHFTDKKLGKQTVIAGHYPRRGRPVDNPEQNVNLGVNIQLAQALGREADEHGKGEALVWYGGDQNINDNIHNTFLGQADFTSASDELNKYAKTELGSIDVIASYDHDGRVEARYIRAVDDQELHMFTDHEPLEAGFRVRVLQ